MFLGRLFERKPKPSDDSTSGSDTPTPANKLRRNRTVSVYTNIAKETASPGVRKHLSIAVPRSKPALHEFTRSAPAGSPRHRITSAADEARPQTSAEPGPQRPRSTFEVPRRSGEPEATPAPAPASPTAGSTRTRGTLRTAGGTAHSSPPRSPGEPRPRVRRGSSAPPSVAGVVRAELDADGLTIHDAHALRAEPVLVVPHEQVAEFCAEVLVWEEAGADAAEPEAVPHAVVFTAEPEAMPDAVVLTAEPEAAAARAAPVEHDEPAQRTVALVPLSAPPTLSTPPKKSSLARMHVRRRAQSLMYVLCDMPAPLKTWY